uniref:Uncharacterized protein LOC113794017 n=1 Tax=Dermatophagoides pteronyssinus TaxID=6956 RepID=A0A6P6Y3Q8_DERPT|nr:uncharacterized protein LOC113794017 [Dermatophagoides pteronyssinus]
MELSEVRLRKSIPNAHSEELASVVARNFLAARNFPENIPKIMAKYCGSVHLQNQFLEEQPSHVQPMNITTSHPELSIHYFSVGQIIKSILDRYPSIINSIEGEKSLRFEDANERKFLVINNELDTVDESIFNRLRGKLRMEISIDDYSFCGNKGKKFVSGYLACSNLPLQKRVKRDQIHLFLLAKRPKIEDAMNKILEPFVLEMQELERSGISIKNDQGEEIKITPTLSKIICDNLSQNEILGLSMGFGSGSVCRECLGRREHYSKTRSHEILDSTNSELQQSAVNVRRDCILTRLNGVTITNIAPPDIFHDVFDWFVTLSDKEKHLDYSVTYKLHKLLHYAANIRRFGPMYLSSTMRYERCHQNSKRYGRVMGCWKSPAATLSERLALRQTVTSIRKITTDQWVNQSTISVYDAQNLGFELGNQDQGDFVLGKNVLRRLIIPGYRPKMWLKAIKFLIHPETRQIMVKGSIWYEVYSEDETPEKKFNLQRIRTFGETVIMNSERLSHINDFIYKWKDDHYYVNRFF